MAEQKNLTYNHYRNRLTVKECSLDKMIEEGEGSSVSARQLMEEIENIQQRLEDIENG